MEGRLVPRMNWTAERSREKVSTQCNPQFIREGGVIPDTLSVVVVASLVFDSRKSVPKQKQQRIELYLCAICQPSYSF